MIIFQNEGAIDMRGVTTFGLSGKASNAVIGRFGTGLKYAIAVVLREGGSITIASGDDIYSFSVVEEDFRGATKKFVFMARNGDEAKPLGFTTDLGLDWEPWQAFRELYSNTKDESGSIAHAEHAPSRFNKDQTTIITELRAFDAIFYSLEEYFIGDGEAPLWENDEIAIYAGRSKHVFYQGIRILETKKPCAFRYNIKRFVSLTEDRTAKYVWEIEARLAANIPYCDVELVCRDVVGRLAEFEADLDYVDDCKGTPSTTFCGAVVASRCAPPRALQLVKMALPDDPSLISIARPETPGSKELSTAVAFATSAGLDHSEITFVLGHGLPIPGAYTIRDRNVFFSSRIVEDAAEMRLAVIMAIADISSEDPKRFLADRIASILESA